MLNTILLKSKTHKKIVRDAPLDMIMLETDSPWLAPNPDEDKRNTPLSIKLVAQKIAEIKHIDYEEVWHQTALNAVRFFGLPLNIESS